MLLREYGWDKSIFRHLRYGGKVIGICGGYQMLGKVIDDPKGIESIAGSTAGLGLLDIETVLEPSKTLKEITGKLQLTTESLSSNKCNIKGYEIHCGISTYLKDYQPFAILGDGRHDGCISDDGLILGTYIHGLFDYPELTNTLLNWAGLNASNAINLDEHREQQLNRLADCLEENLTDEFYTHLIGEEKYRDSFVDHAKSSYTKAY